MKRVAPELTSAQLTFGHTVREPVSKIDLAFMNKGYLGAAVRKVNTAISKQVTGSAHALSSLDAAFQFFRHLRTKVGPIIGGHFGIENEEHHIYWKW